MRGSMELGVRNKCRWAFPTGESEQNRTCRKFRQVRTIAITRRYGKFWRKISEILWRKRPQKKEATSDKMSTVENGVPTWKRTQPTWQSELTFLQASSVHFWKNIFIASVKNKISGASRAWKAPFKIPTKSAHNCSRIVDTNPEKFSITYCFYWRCAKSADTVCTFETTCSWEKLYLSSEI